MKTQTGLKRGLRPSALLGWATLLLVAAAQARPQSLPASLQACRTEPNEARRLQCYDREVDRLRVTPPEGAPKAVLEAPRTQEPAAPTRILMFSAKISALRFRRSGALVATLDNGQVWTQYGPEGKVPIAVGDTVTIRPGWLGSYLMVGPSAWITKVHPLQDTAHD